MLHTDVVLQPPTLLSGGCQGGSTFQVSFRLVYSQSSHHLTPVNIREAKVCGIMMAMVGAHAQYLE